MIKIIKDIIPFGRIGFKIRKGAEVDFSTDITTILAVRYKYGDKTLTVPIMCKDAGISLNDFLDEICRLNTGHNSYLQYNNSLKK